MDEYKATTLEEFEERLQNRPLWKKVWNRARYTVRSWADFPYHIKRIKWFVQRGKRGYADCDWWCLHSYLIDIILPMLKQLRTKNMGYPGFGQASTPEKWEALLGEMIEGFEIAKKIDDLDNIDEIDADQKLFRKKMVVFNRWFFHLWD